MLGKADADAIADMHDLVRGENQTRKLLELAGNRCAIISIAAGDFNARRV